MNNQIKYPVELAQYNYKPITTIKHHPLYDLILAPELVFSLTHSIPLRKPRTSMEVWLHIYLV